LDIIINTSNNWSDWKLALQLVRKGGVIVNLGFPGRGEPQPDFNPLDPQYVYFKSIQIKPLQYIDETNVAPEVFRFNMKRNLEYIVQNLMEGKLTTDMLISEYIPYTMLQEQYEKYLNRENQLFTSVLNWTHA
jgi:threonine dehydrogenase-like Zn-dependent dehydrogenase